VGVECEITAPADQNSKVTLVQVLQALAEIQLAMERPGEEDWDGLNAV
jgi:hypothetical protein